MTTPVIPQKVKQMNLLKRILPVLAMLGLASSMIAKETQSLDGTWQIVFDPANEGRAHKWTTQEVFQSLDARAIEVPSCWEEIEQDYEGVATYGKTFRVPPGWEGKTVRLQFDAVNYIAEVWLNDHCIGRHEGGYGSFEFQVDDLLEFDDENFLSLRVLGPIVHTKQVIDGIGQNDMPHWRGAITGGIWQSVRLVASGSVFVDDVFIIPHLKDDTATVRLQLNNAKTRSAKSEISILISDKDGMVTQQHKTIKLLPGINESEWKFSIPAAKRWSPKEPNLYSVTIEVKDSDEKTVRFGMREFTIRDNRFELNGEPIYLKAAFFEGLYPLKLAVPDSREMAIREIQLAKEAGFNMIRPWRKPPPPGWLDLCDEMGVLVVGGFPIECMNNWPTVTPHVRDRIENEVRSAILRDRNRACIVQWEIFNEIYRKDLHRFKHRTSMLARKLDPSRLILDESGGFAGGSNIYLPYQWEPEVFNDVHIYPGAPVSQRTFDGFLVLAKTDQEIRDMGLEVPQVDSLSVIKPGLLTYVSEIGYGSLPDLVDNNLRFAKNGNPLAPATRYHLDLARSYTTALKDSGMDKVYPSLQDFCMDQQSIHGKGNKRMIEAIRLNSSTCGYAVHALTGGDWVVGAGLLDLFRNPKQAVYEATKEANAERYLAVNVLPRNVYAEQGATLRLTGINDVAPVGGELRIWVKATDGSIVFEKDQNVDLDSGIVPLDEFRIDTQSWSGQYSVHAQLVGINGETITQNSVALEVFSEEQLTPKMTNVAIVDSDGPLGSFLKQKGFKVTQFSKKTRVSHPVLVAGSTTDAQNGLLKAFAAKGGTVIYLERGENPLPVSGGKSPAEGLWVGVAHVVSDHPIFDGLPVNGLMGQTYENVWAMKTLKDLDTQPIVASITHDHWPAKRGLPSYLGPEDAWWGTDLGIVKQGKGRFVLSALRLVDNLGKDPVADKILFNIIGFSNLND